MSEEIIEPKKNTSNPILLKLALMFGILFLWYGSQMFLKHLKSLMPAAFDRPMTWLAPLNDFYHQHPYVQNAILIGTSADVDITGVILILMGLFGDSVLPYVSLFIFFIFRQICQFLINEPIPEGMIWHYPGFPSLIVTYFTTSDFFFSGHTGVATLGALNIANYKYKNSLLFFLAIILVALQVFFIISMRFHWSIDVITGIFAACTAFMIGQRIAPFFDDIIKRKSYKDE